MRRSGCSAGVPAASVRAGVLGTPLCPLSPLPADALAERAFLAAGGHHLSPASSPLPSLGLEAVGCRDMSGDGAHWWEGVNHHGPGCSRTAMGDGWAAGGQMMPRSPIPREGACPGEAASQSSALPYLALGTDHAAHHGRDRMVGRSVIWFPQPRLRPRLRRVLDHAVA